jgi:ABC-type Na+ efflux pump permease subunit
MTARAPHVPALATVATIARREARAALSGLGVYVATSIAMVAATWLLLIDVRALRVAGLLVPADPYRAPLDVALLVLAFFFAVSAAVSTARDRETGTLEVLFFGPVDEITYCLGKVCGLLAVYALMMPVLALSLAALSLMSGLALPGSLGASLVFSLIPAAMVLSLGLVLSIGTRRVRSAVLILGGVALILVGGSAAYSIVLLVPIENPSSPVVALRDVLAAVNGVLRWVSPFAYLQRIVAEGVAIGAWRSAAIAAGFALAASGAMIVLAAQWLRWRGVQKAGE